MKVTVRFFGPAAERAGRSSQSLALREGATVADLGKALDLNGVRFAIGTDYAAADAKLRDGDVVSVIPPVGGG